MKKRELIEKSIEADRSLWEKYKKCSEFGQDKAAEKGSKARHSLTNIIIAILNRHWNTINILYEL